MFQIQCINLYDVYPDQTTTVPDSTLATTQYHILWTEIHHTCRLCTSLLTLYNFNFWHL